MVFSLFWHDFLNFVSDLGEVFSVIWQGVKEEPAKFQHLIGGSLAFLGVLLTVWTTGRRLRKQLAHATKLDEIRHTRDKEAQRSSLKGALSAELSVISSFLKAENVQLKKWMSPDWKTIDELDEVVEHELVEETGFSRDELVTIEINLMVPYRFSLPERDGIYRALLGEIAVLRPMEVRAIITAYDTFQSFKSWVKEHCDGTVDHTEVYTFSGEKSLKELHDQIEETRTTLDWKLSTLMDEGERKKEKNWVPLKRYLVFMLIAIGLAVPLAAFVLAC